MALVGAGIRVGFSATGLPLGGPWFRPAASRPALLSLGSVHVGPAGRHVRLWSRVVIGPKTATRTADRTYSVV